MTTNTFEGFTANDDVIEHVLCYSPWPVGPFIGDTLEETGSSQPDPGKVACSPPSANDDMADVWD
jgi:hypothetical protein